MDLKDHPAMSEYKQPADSLPDSLLNVVSVLLSILFL